MSKGKLSVRISTKKVIQSLETALKKLDSDRKEQQKQHEDFKKDSELAVNEAMKLAVGNSKKIESIDIHPRRDGSVQINFVMSKNVVKLPKQPTLNISDYQYTAKREEIEQFLRLLKMTDDETVNTSTYNAISQYL